MRVLRAVPCAVLAALSAGCGDELLPPTEDPPAVSPALGARTPDDLVQPDRPFNAEVHGLVTFAPDVAGRCRTPTFGIITLSVGTGQVTHLGRVQFSSSHCPEPPAGPPPPYGLIERGEWTFVAANGDELHATYEGEQLTPLFENPTLVRSELVFSGGTGRFSGASGWARAEGRLEVPAAWETEPWSLQLTLRGRIRY